MITGRVTSQPFPTVFWSLWGSRFGTGQGSISQGSRVPREPRACPPSTLVFAPSSPSSSRKCGGDGIEKAEGNGKGIESGFGAVNNSESPLRVIRETGDD